MQALTVHHVCTEPNHHRKEIKSIPNLGIQLEYCRVCESISLARLCWVQILNKVSSVEGVGLCKN